MAVPDGRVLSGLLLAAAVLAVVGSEPGAAATPNHFVAVGDVTASSALLWARADRPGTLHVVLTGGRHGRIGTAVTRAARDFTARVRLRGLAPATRYRYRARFGARPRPPVLGGSFRTAPAARVAMPLRLDFRGDLAGQNVCRDAAEGFPILTTVRARRPDVFVGLGDMIYADNSCSMTGLYGNDQVPGTFGPAADLASYWAHWRYARADGRLQRLLASTDYVGVWDDHEVVNDFGPFTDTRDSPPYTPGVHLMPIGLQAFLDYTPVAVSSTAPMRLYRTLRWGRNLQLFVLDTRQYRDPSFAPDTDARPKTMLGHEQLTWLKRSLAASNATWKVIVSSVPMSIPTGSRATGRDGWANFGQTTGYERELLDILRFMRGSGIRNTVWITTDVHFAEAFRYVPFPDDPRFAVYELVTGPMNAGIFPTTDFDRTLHPQRLALFGPASPGAVTSWAEAKRWFNFGELELAADRSLTLRIVDAGGQTRFERRLAPRAR